MEHRLKPVTNMIDNVATSQVNINTALHQIEGVYNGIKETNQTIDVLYNKVVLSKEPHYYFETMKKAIQLIDDFDRDTEDNEDDLSAIVVNSNTSATSKTKNFAYYSES